MGYFCIYATFISKSKPSQILRELIYFSLFIILAIEVKRDLDRI